jgi:uncharacterized SAM-binding protein YcdF (DUF218 family)
MFFTLSKILWFIIEPLNLLLLSVLACTLLFWTGSIRAAKVILTAASIVIMTVTLFPVGDAMLRPLEQRFQTPAVVPDKLDGIILLGGAQEPLLTRAYHQPALNGAAETLTTFLALAKAHPEAKLVFSGGSGEIRHQDINEADTVRLFLQQQSFDPDRLSYETHSHNTYENVTFSKRLIQPKPGERWLLVTSAYGMPRAVGVFRAAGWPVIPYPCNYHVGRRLHMLPSLHFAESFASLEMAVHEWVGLMVYYLTGKTDVFFPV